MYRRAASSAITVLIATMLAASALAFASASSASAYTHDFECKPASDEWCWDPSVTANWQEGKTKLEKGYNAYLCVGIKKESWSTGLCSSEPYGDGDAFTWKWGGEFSGYDPLRGGGLQDNAEGNAQLIWSWFYEP